MSERQLRISNALYRISPRLWQRLWFDRQFDCEFAIYPDEKDQFLNLSMSWIDQVIKVANPAVSESDRSTVLADVFKNAQAAWQKIKADPKYPIGTVWSASHDEQHQRIYQAWLDFKPDEPVRSGKSAVEQFLQNQECSSYNLLHLADKKRDIHGNFMQRWADLVQYANLLGRTAVIGSFCTEVYPIRQHSQAVRAPLTFVGFDPTSPDTAFC